MQYPNLLNCTVGTVQVYIIPISGWGYILYCKSCKRESGWFYLHLSQVPFSSSLKGKILKKLKNFRYVKYKVFLLFFGKFSQLWKERILMIL